MWSVLIGPCFVLTVVPSIKGNRSRCTPSRLTSAPLASARAHTLSISSKNTMPFSCTDSNAMRVTVSSSNSLSASSPTNTSWLSATVILRFTVRPPKALPNISPIFIMPIWDPCCPGMSNMGIGFAVSETSISISWLSNSPSSNLRRNISRVASRASGPAIASITRSWACFNALAFTSSRI